MDKKVLVCITPQSNSKRLIDKGYKISLEKKGELHILNVIKGNNIFTTLEESLLMQQLFTYASELGGTVHGLCGDDVYGVMKKFIKDNFITNVVFGAPPKGVTFDSNSIIYRIQLEFPYIDVCILERAE